MINNIQNIHTSDVNSASGSVVKPSDAMDFFIMEIWKDIQGYEGLYQVSNLGNVKRLARAHNLSPNFIVPEKILAKKKHYNGYALISMSKNGKQKYTSVHSLVAKAFIHNPENKPQVNHINGIKNDNRVENLEWVTSHENLIHAHKIGTKVGAKGEKSFRSKLKNEDVIQIKKMIMNGFGTSFIARMFGVKPNAISKIKYNQTWSHINL